MVSLSNGFLEYVTTADEYTAQYYEGGSTLFGPGSAAMLARSTARLVRMLSGGDALPSLTAPPVRVSPGRRRAKSVYHGDIRPLAAAAWCRKDTLYARLGLGRRGGWLMRDSTEEGAPLVQIREEDQGRAGEPIAADGDPTVELHFNPQRSSAPWELRWSPAPTGRYQVLVRGSSTWAIARCHSAAALTRR